MRATTNLVRFPCLVLCGALSTTVLAPGTAVADAGAAAPEGWSTRAPRDEIRPAFAYRPEGGPDGRGGFVIEADRREGLMGWWEKTFPVAGGHAYRFSAWRTVRDVASPRRTAVARIQWRDAQGRPVPRDEPARSP
ncbi:MAG TPA: carbon-nitrogen hydrolase family protein, partial [Isosphaeraceae bacterium]